MRTCTRVKVLKIGHVVLTAVVLWPPFWVGWWIRHAAGVSLATSLRRSCAVVSPDTVQAMNACTSQTRRISCTVASLVSCVVYAALLRMPCGSDTVLS